MPSLTRVGLFNMSSNHDLSSFAFTKVCKRLGLLAAQDSLGFLDLSRLLRLPVRRSQKLLFRALPRLNLCEAYAS